jgi:drug/metabolite transporter (DMT)-like permease
MPRNDILNGLGIGLLAALCYGANVPYAKLAAQAGANGPTLVFYRAFLMVAVLGAFGLIRSGSLAVPAGQRGAVVGLGIATSLVGLCYISSVAFIPVGVATILYYTYPLLILMVSPLIDGERVTPLRLGIFALAFVGLFIALGPNASLLDWRGLLLALAGASAAVAQFFFASRATRGSTPIIAGFWAQLILIPIALAACLFAGKVNSPAVLLVAGWPAGMHILLFLLAFGFQLIAARLAPPAVLGLVFCAEPVASILLASEVLGEHLTLAEVGGGSLVLIAVIASVIAEGGKPVAAT